MFILGIGGGSASGKSTLAARLRERFADRRMQVLATDDFFVPVKPKMVSRHSGQPLDDFNQPDSWDLPRFRAAFEAAAADPATELLLVEGIFALYEADRRERYDLTVFVDTPEDHRPVGLVGLFSPARDEDLPDAGKSAGCTCTRSTGAAASDDW